MWRLSLGVQESVDCGGLLHMIESASYISVLGVEATAGGLMTPELSMCESILPLSLRDPLL